MAISPLYMSMESIYTRQADEARGGTHFTQQRINVGKVWVKISTYEWLYVCTWGPLTTSGEEGAESLVPHLSVSNDPLTWRATERERMLYRQTQSEGYRGRHSDSCSEKIVSSPVWKIKLKLSLFEFHFP